MVTVFGRDGRIGSGQTRNTASGGVPRFPFSASLEDRIALGQNSGREWDSLISAEISLIADLNSLQGRKKFPVPMRRELVRKALV